MTRHMSKLDTAAQHFQHIRMSPDDWPLHVWAAIAGSEALAHWPGFPSAATLAHHRLGHGADVDSDIARVRAAGELVEIASCSEWGDEEFVTATRSELSGRAFGPAELSGFSDAQTKDRRRWNKKLKGLDWIPRAADPSSRIDWLSARCLTTEETIFIPADNVLIGRRSPGDPKACAVADTNGCAAGETENDACLRAVFELIERDATARWWYGRRNAPILDPAELRIDTIIPEHLARRGRYLLMLDITSDIGVPTVAALAMDASGRHLGAGFATRANQLAAGRAAVTELMQMELRIMAALSARATDGELEIWFREARFERAMMVRDREEVGSIPHQSADLDLATCASRFDTLGCRVAIRDFSRSTFGVPVVRAVSPDLCHWKPRFGRARLLAGARSRTGGRGDEESCANPQFLRI